MITEKSLFGTDRHSYIELSMSALNIGYDVVTVEVSSVDLRDNSYQTRRNVSESASSVCREYAEKIKGGESFPMIVVEEKSPGRYRVVCGRHRASAYAIAQNGKTAYRAYLIKAGTPSGLLKALSARENNANGVRQSSGDTALAASDHLSQLPIATHGRSHRSEVIKQVALEFGANPSTVKGHYHAKLVAAAMIRVGVQPDGIQMYVLRSLWGWVENAEWKSIAKTVSDNGSLPNLEKTIHSASKDKVDGSTLVKRILKIAEAKPGLSARGGVFKDPVTVTMEHLSLALRDIRDLAPPRNLPDEQAEEIADLVEAVRLAAKEWNVK